MKKALIVVGAALVLGSRKEATVVPCSKTLEVKFYNKGKVVRKEIWKDGNWYLTRLSGVDGVPPCDSLSVDIVPIKLK